MLFLDNYSPANGIVSCELQNPIKVELSQGVIDVLRAFDSKLIYFGLKLFFESPFCEYSFISNFLKFQKSQRSVSDVIVTRVPECFIMRDKLELRIEQVETLQRLLSKLINEIASVLTQTRGGYKLIPSTIHEVLCSTACKGEQ